MSCSPRSHARSGRVHGRVGCSAELVSRRRNATTTSLTAQQPDHSLPHLNLSPISRDVHPPISVPKISSGSLLLLSSRQPSPHVLLVLFMEMGKEVTRFDRLSFQPWKMLCWITQDLIG